MARPFGNALHYKSPKAPGAIFSLAVAIAATGVLMGLMVWLQRVREQPQTEFNIVELDLSIPELKPERIHAEPPREAQPEQERTEEMELTIEPLQPVEALPTQLLELTMPSLDLKIQPLLPVVALPVLAPAPQKSPLPERMTSPKPQTTTQPVETQTAPKPANPVTQATEKPRPGKSLYDLGEVDERPRPVFQPEPIYPFQARRENRTGLVVIGLIVDKNGNVQELSIKRVEGGEAFGTAALNAVRRWKFKPGRHKGEPVAVQMTAEIRFNLKD